MELEVWTDKIYRNQQWLDLSVIMGKRVTNLNIFSSKNIEITETHSNKQLWVNLGRCLWIKVVKFLQLIKKKLLMLQEW